MIDNVELAIRKRGGRLDATTLDGAAGKHLNQVKNLFRGHLERIFVPSPSLLTKATPPSKIYQFEFVDRWDVNAWAILANERPLVLFHAGVPFCLYEYFNALLAQPQILTELNGLAEAADRPFTAPARDFSHIHRQRWPESIALTREQVSRVEAIGGAIDEQARYYVGWSHYLSVRPSTEQRQSVALYAYLTAVEFLFLHEVGHIERGHLEYQCRKNDRAALSEFAVAGETRHFASRACLELDADRYAASQIFGTLLTPRTELQLHFKFNQKTAFRVALFAIGALFVLLQQSEAPSMSSWLGRIASRFRRSPLESHPSPYTRIFAVYANAAKVAEGLDWEGDELEKSITWCFREVDVVGALFNLDVAMGLSQALNNVTLLDSSFAHLREELHSCAQAVKNRYFVEGKTMSLAEAQAAKAPADPSHLRGQYLEMKVGNEWVAIPFLTEDSSLDEFLSNSEKWERVGYMDNAVVYALLAGKRYRDSSTAVSRIESLRQGLGKHFTTIQALIAIHGYKSHLCDELIKAYNVEERPRSESEGMEHLEVLVALRPREPTHRLHLACFSFSARRLELALEHFKVAETLLPPNDIQAVVGIGNVYAELGKTDEACAHFRRALQCEPNSEYAWENLGRCLMRAARPSEALAAMREALGNDARNGKYWFIASAAHDALKENEKALESVKKALECFPKNPQYLVTHGRLCCEDRRFHDAIHSLSLAIDAGAQLDEALYFRAKAKLGTGNLDAAKEDFRASQDAGGKYATYSAQMLERCNKA